MKTKLLLAASALAVFPLFAQEVKRDAAVVREYIKRTVGAQTINEILKQEGGAKFLKTFFGDRAWMEQFAGSGPFHGGAAAALRALDLLVWNDDDGFISTPVGKNVATALALNHGHDFAPEKLVQIMELYSDWAEDGTLDDSASSMDVRKWREVVTFGQNAELPVENLKWIHDFANVAPSRYGGICWQCHYRLNNCFGASVHGPMYYKPWEHRWNTQELRYRVGGVCGALSKFGSHCAEAHGIRSFTAGQPGHCAYMVWNFPENRWDIAYSVTGHTGSHFALGEGYCFTANEEQDRYYSNPKRMGAEYLRWAGEYEKSMRLVPGNWPAAKDWQDALKAANAPKGEWDRYGAAVRETFKTSPYQGWRLYFAYMEKLPAAEKLDAAKKGLLAFRESSAKTVEPLYLDERVLDPLVKMLGGGEATLWELLGPLLEGQSKTPTFFRQAVNWAAGKLMTTPANASRFLDVVGKAALKSGAELDFNGMVLKASQNEDLAMWRQVYSLMDKMAAGKRAKTNARSWPKSLNGMPLLSQDGMLRTSTTSQFEDPVNYREALESEGRDVSHGAAFHTGKEVSPWGMVVLPGPAEVAAVTVVNAGGGQNAGRQVPLKVWISDDGKEFREVGSAQAVQNEWKFSLPAGSKAKYVKVGRVPEQRDEFFHLYKILVYGKKLY